MLAAQVGIDVLGPSAARVGDVPVAMGARRLRSLLALLVLERGRPVAAERIIDALWEGAPPPGAANTLQGYVAGLRRLLEPGRRPRAASSLLVHEASGYRLAVHPEQVDVERFQAAVRSARERLRRLPDPMRPALLPDLPVGPGVEAAEARRAGLTAALRLWRGEAYADLGELPAAVAERHRLEQLRLEARVARAVIDLSLDRPSSAAAALEDLAGRHPLRERLWGLWAVALVRDGRQAEGLAVLATLRSRLADELGVDPTPALAAMQADVLLHHPAVLGLDRGVARDESRAHRAVVVLDGGDEQDHRLADELVRRARGPLTAPGRASVGDAGACTHDGCCRQPVVVVVVDDGPGQHPGVGRRPAHRDPSVTDPAQRSPFRDDHRRRGRTFPA
ncbi:AfsR/SARP family transcriptional regulator [Nocardioides sp. zg-1228]|uniref:AfsR/SARP family transcriptional regulator n=1 Tax=Nocardioides sp. zg-1228 TaxID=2763008 RepID=UPI0016430BD6|nr:AfsR/SARP family transcriptional regulator [Nocardioides sp. zg-1228]MBC2931684.1 AfsR/SARP family transcriptional regulator [Nocardioides sp. zg-1228]QSF57273.1 AfsR/SARP family transcriptional regulator [Nocardioides sp. zg-1228]